MPRNYAGRLKAPEEELVRVVRVQVRGALDLDVVDRDGVGVRVDDDVGVGADLAAVDHLLVSRVLDPDRAVALHPLAQAGARLHVDLPRVRWNGFARERGTPRVARARPPTGVLRASGGGDRQGQNA